MTTDATEGPVVTDLGIIHDKIRRLYDAFTRDDIEGMYVTTLDILESNAVVGVHYVLLDHLREANEQIGRLNPDDPDWLARRLDDTSFVHLMLREHLRGNTDT